MKKGIEKIEGGYGEYLILTAQKYVQVRNEKGKLGIIEVPKDKREMRLAKLPLIWQRYLEPTFIISILAFLLAAISWAEWLVILSSMSIAEKVFLFLLVLILVPNAVVFVLGPPTAWIVNSYQNFYKKHLMGVIKARPLKGFVEKFAQENNSLGWIVEQQLLVLAFRFYQQNPEEFEKAVAKTQNGKEFQILYGLRR